MTYILTAWKESARLLWTRSGFLLFLVTLKTIGQGYKTWLKYWGWLLLVMGALQIFFNSYCVSHSGLSTLCMLIPYVFPVFLYIAVFLTMVLAVRPSVYRKTYGYFGQYLLPCVAIVLILFALILLLNVMMVEVRPLYFVLYYVLNTLQFLRTSFIVFFCLFFFDSSKSALAVLSSSRRAVQLLLYALPLVIVVTLLLGIIQGCFLWVADHGIQLIVSHFWPATGHVSVCYVYFKIIAELIFLPIWISAFSNIYIKNLYDHMERYFPRRG